MSHKEKSKSEFALCSCFGRKSLSDDSFYTNFEKDEPTDYIVEKLAIQRVPVRVFATEDDFLSVGSSSKESSVKPEKSETTSEVSEEKSEASYDEDREITVTSKETEKESTKTEESEIRLTEQQLLLQMLNNYKQLCTCDPRNPNRECTNPLCSLKAYLIKNQDKRLSKETLCKLLSEYSPSHKTTDLTSVDKNTNRCRGRQNKSGSPGETSVPVSRRLTPELQQTLEKLGTARKPRVFPPCNMRNRVNSETDSAPITLQPTGKCGCRKRILERGKVYVDRCSCPVHGEKRQEGNLSDIDSNKFDLKNATVLPCFSPNEPRFLRSIRNPPETIAGAKEDQQITEISQLTGENLKWKIIIKHHGDNDQERSHLGETDDYDLEESVSDLDIIGRGKVNRH